MHAMAEMSHPTTIATCSDEALCRHLHDIVQTRRLTALFQPILDLHQAQVMGLEGLIRGPSGSPLHSPVALFRVARNCGLVTEVEYLSRRIVLESFAELDSPGRIFLNVSPDVLLQRGMKAGNTLKFIERLGLQPSQVIIEITENAPTVDYQLLRDATRHYRSMGFEIAIDDLGEGFSGLRLWSEIRPDYVKIDQHFIHNIHLDPVKRQFVRSIEAIAAQAGARVIAEGIESYAELTAVRDLGIAYGQGHLIARPTAAPSREIPAAIRGSLMPTEPACGIRPRQCAAVDTLAWAPSTAYRD